MKGGGRLNGIEFQLEVDSLAGADGQLEFLVGCGRPVHGFKDCSGVELTEERRSTREQERRQ